MATNRIQLTEQCRRRGFSIIFDELWTDYLPHIGGPGVLLYCFLKFMSGREIPNPCSTDWDREVCQVLGISVPESHNAWARMQEMGLISLVEGAYVLMEPQAVKSKEAEHNKDANSVFTKVEHLFGRPLSMTEIKQLDDLSEGYSSDLLVLAADVGVQAGALSMSYIKQVLLNWRAKGISSTEQAIADLEQFRLKKARRHARKSERPITKEDVHVPQSALSYEDEAILRRIKKNFGEEVVGNGE